MKKGALLSRLMYSAEIFCFSARMKWSGKRLMDRGEFLDVDSDGRTHRRRERAALDVIALGRVRPRLGDRFNDRPGVLFQLLGVEGGLAHGNVDVAGLVDLELDAARLDFPDCPG